MLNEIAVYLEMDDVPFKPRAYEKVAEVVERWAEAQDIINTRSNNEMLRLLKH